MNASPNWDPGCAGEVAAPDAGGRMRFGCWRRWEMRRESRKSHDPWEVCDTQRVSRDVLEEQSRQRGAVGAMSSEPDGATIEESRQRGEVGAMALEPDGATIEEYRQPWEVGGSGKCDSLGRREHHDERSYESLPQWESANLNSWCSRQRWEVDCGALASGNAMMEASQGEGDSSIMMPDDRLSTAERSRGRWDSCVRRPRRVGKALRMALEGLGPRSTVLGSGFNLHSLS